MNAKSLALSVAMAAACAAAVALTPKQLYPKDYRPPVTLAQQVPKAFGEWKIDEYSDNHIVNPSLEAQLAQFYSDTLSRTYVNPKGERVMLSLAYGADQGRAMQVHKPEVCYEAQGLRIVQSAKAELAIGNATVPAMHLVARAGQRVEPITYWIRTGDYIVRGWFEQNTARVKNGLIRGYVPDGILVRVSTFDTDLKKGYDVQRGFLSQLMVAADPKLQKMLLGEDKRRELASH
jgi:EpsI family protein